MMKEYLEIKVKIEKCYSDSHMFILDKVFILLDYFLVLSKRSLIRTDIAGFDNKECSF